MSEKVASLIKGGAGIDKYSASETKTNKVWIDGKPIYRRVISWKLSNVYDVTSWNIDNLINVGGYVVQSNNNILPLPYYVSNQDSVAILLMAGKTELRATVVGNYATANNAQVIIEYTKSTI